MIYLGHFSFDTELKGEGRKKEPWHAKFTAVAEAENIEKALAKFHSLIGRSIKNRYFDNLTDDIYMDVCLEIKNIPRGGVIGLVSYEEGETNMISNVPSASSRSVTVWSLEDEEDENSEKPYAFEPFFRVKKKKPKA